jgi:hypothetical protein
MLRRMLSAMFLLRGILCERGFAGLRSELRLMCNLHRKVLHPVHSHLLYKLRLELLPLLPLLLPPVLRHMRPLQKRSALQYARKHERCRHTD